jgi:hypothetical protein
LFNLRINISFSIGRSSFENARNLTAEIVNNTDISKKTDGKIYYLFEISIVFFIVEASMEDLMTYESNRIHSHRPVQYESRGNWRRRRGGRGRGIFGPVFLIMVIAVFIILHVAVIMVVVKKACHRSLSELKRGSDILLM